MFQSNSCMLSSFLMPPDALEGLQFSIHAHKDEHHQQGTQINTKSLFPLFLPSFPASLLGDPKEPSATRLQLMIEAVCSRSEHVILWTFMLCQTSLNIHVYYSPIIKYRHLCSYSYMLMLTQEAIRCSDYALGYNLGS